MRTFLKTFAKSIIKYAYCLALLPSMKNDIIEYYSVKASLFYLTCVM